MANPRRSSAVFSSAINTSLESPFQSLGHTRSFSLSASFSYLKHFLKKPHAFPFLLSIFLFLTWISLRLQRSSRVSSSAAALSEHNHEEWNMEDDGKANLIRFRSGFPSEVAKDERGWLLNPISLALDSGVSGGAVTCLAIHAGEIRPGAVRGNHRHYDCNETFVIWGARTKFRVENNEGGDKGYAEVIIGADEVAVAASPAGTAHALVNSDPIRSTYFLGCQDNFINNSSSTYKVWKDL